MEVFLIPTGDGRHELYCEVPDEQASPPAYAGARRFGLSDALQRAFMRLHRAAAAAEAAELDAAVETPRGRWRSFPRVLRQRVLRWVAERIAEQRLLWHLRHQQSATLVHPEDLAAAEAMAILQRALERDGIRHLRWLVVDAGGFLASLVLVPIPGPNVLLWYFAFRVVGHALSFRGARQGRFKILWQTRASAALSELRLAVSLAPADRQRRIQALASQLRLPRLPRFFDRTAVAP